MIIAIAVPALAGVVRPPRQTTPRLASYLNIEPEGNFFTHPLDTETITVTDRREELIEAGYEKMAENDQLVLYLLKETLGIAVYDKVSGYTWQSEYPHLADLPNPPTGVVAARIRSGVTIEYYDANTSTVTSATLSFTEATGKVKSTFKKIANGFRADVDFSYVGIKFAVEVTIDGASLRARVPEDSIEEYEVDRLKRLLRFHLKSISLFPYFGSANHEINGYALIPDGSGALIRYSEEPSATGFIKRVYGPDYGFTQASVSNPHLKEATPVSLPIYGIAHGYNQAAFLAEIESGAGAAEIHSYPYMYNNIPINTTFFKLITRDTFTIEISSGQVITLLNDEPYPNDYGIKYSFLRGDAANYVGMAKAYRTNLGLNQSPPASPAAPLRLQVLGLDYKHGLFGKNYRTMTTFAETLDIIRALEENGVANFQISYLGWNKGGYYNRGKSGRKIAGRLGDLKPLVTYVEANGYAIDYTINPLLSGQYGFGAKTVKKISLAPFVHAEESALANESYFLDPAVLWSAIKDKEKYYDKRGMSAFNIDNLAAAFSYRYKDQTVYREQMIAKILEGLTALTGEFIVSTANPNDYLLAYLVNYYDAPFQASGFLYETDSVPFLSILLSGHVQMFAPDVNFLSDYRLAALRMIEYNLYPSFIVTAAPAHRLRYTNFEHLLSTEYRLWEEIIVETYATVNGALGAVHGKEIIDHYYPAPGVARIAYAGGTVIYVNYGASAYDSGDGIVSAGGYLVTGGEG